MAKDNTLGEREAAKEARNFQETIKNIIINSSKKPSAARATQAIAVQLVDKTGKIEKTGAGGVEKEREKLAREKLQLSLLKKIAEGITGFKKKELPEKKGKGMFSGIGGMLTGLMAGLLPAGAIAALGGMSVLGTLGIGAVVLGGVYAAVTAIGDGIKGIKWAKEMKLEGVSGWIGGFLGGDQKGGVWNAVANGFKGVGLGATTGLMLGGPVGMLVGALLGGALFGIMGFFGAEAIAEIIDPVVKHFKRLFGLSVEIDEEKMKKLEETTKMDEKIIASLTDQLKSLGDARKKALSAVIVDQDLVDELTIKMAEISTQMLPVAKRNKENKENLLAMERDNEKNALNAAEEALTANEIAIGQHEFMRRKYAAQVQRFGKDTLEGKNAQIQLDATRAKLRITRRAQQKLRDDVDEAEKVLLAEDRRLVKKAGEDQTSAPWRARLNVFTSDFPKMMEENMKSLTDWQAKNRKAVKDAVIKIKGMSKEEIAAWIGEMAKNIWGNLKEFFWAKDGTSGMLQFTLPEIKLKMPEFEFDFDIQEMMDSMMPEFAKHFSPSRIMGEMGRTFEAIDFHDITGVPNWMGDILRKALLGIFDPTLGTPLHGKSDFQFDFAGHGFAKGGTFKKGEGILVGELGPEAIFPNVSGTVIPNHKLGGGDERMTKVLEALTAQLAAGSGANIDASSVNMSSAPTTVIGQAIAPRQRVAVNG